MKPIIDDHGFEKMVQTMITKKQHADYMKQALDEYRAYWHFMNDAFLDQPRKEVFIIRATYRQEKHVWREIEILGTQTLADLASSIVESMDWVEDHLHGFWFPDRRRNRIYGDYGIFHEAMEDDPHPTFKTKDVFISQIDWKTYPKIGFVFDFGDGHEFDIEVKATREKESSDNKKSFPRLIDQRGISSAQCPPCEEDDEENEF